MPAYQGIETFCFSPLVFGEIRVSLLATKKRRAGHFCTAFCFATGRFDSHLESLAPLNRNTQSRPIIRTKTEYMGGMPPIACASTAQPVRFKVGWTEHRPLTADY